MAPKWVQPIKAKLAANPLFLEAGTLVVKCKACGGTGKKIALYQVTNYGSTFAVCSVCKKDYSR